MQTKSYCRIAPSHRGFHYDVQNGSHIAAFITTSNMVEEHSFCPVIAGDCDTEENKGQIVVISHGNG